MTALIFEANLRPKENGFTRSFLWMFNTRHVEIIRPIKTTRRLGVSSTVPQHLKRLLNANYFSTASGNSQTDIAIIIITLNIFVISFFGGSRFHSSSLSNQHLEVHGKRYRTQVLSDMSCSSHSVRWVDHEVFQENDGYLRCGYAWNCRGALA